MDDFLLTIWDCKLCGKNYELTLTYTNTSLCPACAKLLADQYLAQIASNEPVAYNDN